MQRFDDLVLSYFTDGDEPQSWFVSDLATYFEEIGRSMGDPYPSEAEIEASLQRLVAAGKFFDEGVGHYANAAVHGILQWEAA